MNHNHGPNRGNKHHGRIAHSQYLTYSDEQWAFIQAMDTWRRRHGRLPDAAEILAIAIALGYRK